MSPLWKTAALLAGLCLGGQAMATDLYSPGQWSAMATDRQAGAVGDSLTVIVYENSLGQNTAQTGSKREGAISGAIGADDRSDTAQMRLNGQFDSTAQNGRSGKLVAQISVVVDAILPNGDLHVSGQQLLNISGERTRINLKGRVRRQDISNYNTVLSSRLADAVIDYDGTGFVSRGGKPGVVGRIFNWLGLM